MALEGKFVGYIENDNGYLLQIPVSRKVMDAQGIIIKESEEVSNPEREDPRHSFETMPRMLKQH